MYTESFTHQNFGGNYKVAGFSALERMERAVLHYLDVFDYHEVHVLVALRYVGLGHNLVQLRAFLSRLGSYKRIPQ